MKTFNYVSNLPKLVDMTTEEINGKRYYVTPLGSKFPSVTTVLSAGSDKKKSLAQWRERIGEDEAKKVMQRASTRGTKFHNMMEKYLSNDNTLFENVMPDMKQAFNDVKEVINLIDNIHYIECPLYSEKLGLAGRTDVIAEFGKTLSIIDFKTSLKLKKEEWITDYFIQATAYREMLREMTGLIAEQIVIIISVDGETEPQVFIKNPDDYVDLLVSKIKEYKESNNVS